MIKNKWLWRVLIPVIKVEISSVSIQELYAYNFSGSFTVAICEPSVITNHSQ